LLRKCIQYQLILMKHGPVLHAEEPYAWTYHRKSKAEGAKTAGRKPACSCRDSYQHICSCQYQLQNLHIIMPDLNEVSLNKVNQSTSAKGQDIIHMPDAASVSHVNYAAVAACLNDM